MKKANTVADDELRREYKRSDFGELVRGRFVKEPETASNIIVLNPEVAAAFPNGAAVNAALKSLIDIAKRTSH